MVSDASRGEMVAGGYIPFSIPLVLGRGAVSIGVGLEQSSMVALLVTAYAPLIIRGFIIAGLIGGVAGALYGTHADNPQKERYTRNFRTYSMGLFACALLVGLVLDLVLCSGILSTDCVDIIPYV